MSSASADKGCIQKRQLKRQRLCPKTKEKVDSDVKAWFWSSTFDANDPSEDRHCCRPNVRISSLDNNDKVHIFVVCDGHGGGMCADFVIEHLPLQVVNKLNQCNLRESVGALDLFRIQVSGALKSAFLKTDSLWLERIGMNNSRRTSQKACEKNGKWSVGTCALLVLIMDIKSTGKVIFTAHCGDVRACLFPFEDVGVEMKDRKSLQCDVLTDDHNVKNQKEVQRMRKECLDPNPVRPNKNNEMRVAGSLVPTRAIGDAYLKLQSHSFEPFQKFCPYISSLPEINMRFIEKSNRSSFLLVVATDGVWDIISYEDIFNILPLGQNDFMFEGTSKFSDNPSSAVIDIAVEKICAKLKIKRRVLQASRRGLERRTIHDDMTSLVIYFS